MEKEEALDPMEQARPGTDGQLHDDAWHLQQNVKALGRVADGIDSCLPCGRKPGHTRRVASAGAQALAWLRSLVGPDEVRADVLAECRRRVEKYGPGRLHDETHLKVTVKELGEAARCMDGTDPRENMRAELVQVAASLAGWLEQIQ